MARRRSKKRKAEADAQEEQPSAKRTRGAPSASAPDPGAAVLAVGPTGRFCAVALGTRLLLHDRETDRVATLAPDGGEPGCVRALAFSACGRWLLSGGDDKAAHLWDLATLRLRHSWQVPKKAVAAAFAPGHALFGDKFGDAHAAALPGTGGLENAGAAHWLLGHFCTPVTAICLDPTGALLVTTNTDGGVRVTCVPQDPLQGAHEIQSLCQGHTAAVTCAAFLAPSEGAAAEGVLLTGSADGTVRAWEPLSGRCLALHQASTLPAAPAAPGEDPAPEPPSSIQAAGESSGGVPQSIAAAETEGKTARPSTASAGHAGDGEDQGGQGEVAEAGTVVAGAEEKEDRGAVGAAATVAPQAGAEPDEATGEPEEGTGVGDEEELEGVEGEGAGAEGEPGAARERGWGQRRKRPALPPAVRALAVGPSGLVAVAVEGQRSVQLLALRGAPGEAHSLSRTGTLELGPGQCPHSLAFCGEELLVAGTLQSGPAAEEGAPEGSPAAAGGRQEGGAEGAKEGPPRLFLEAAGRTAGTGFALLPSHSRLAALRAAWQGEEDGGGNLEQ